MNALPAPDHGRSRLSRSRGRTLGGLAWGLALVGVTLAPAALAGPLSGPAAAASVAYPTPPPVPPPPGHLPPPHHGGPGDASNDPAGLPGASPQGATATCYQSCSVTTELADAQAKITATDDRLTTGSGSFQPADLGGRDRAVLFASRNGGLTKPDCPNYTETFTDWVQFGFQSPARGADYSKTGTFILHHAQSRVAAAAASRRLQICFEAPYAFLDRPGFKTEQHGTTFVGVLPECTTVTKRQIPAGVAAPCVRRRGVVRSGNGWVVRIEFSVPAGLKDPKALG